VPVEIVNEYPPVIECPHLVDGLGDTLASEESVIIEDHDSTGND
jgi:hypothetical protein